MTNVDFIEEIAKYVIKYAPQFEIKVASPIIAQACLESAYGTSSKAAHHNYFGMKFRNNRVSCNNGTFVDDSAEQNADGSYRNIKDKWYNFDNMEMGVLGYFQFTNISNYSKTKKATTPQEYLEALKKANYASSLKYVQNNMNVINTWNLTRFDDILNQPSNILYRVQVGAFRNIDNAKKLQNQLKEAGFDAFITTVEV